MGRRALRKIDPSLDLTRYLLELESLVTPLKREQVFDRPGPLEVEVGSGKGLFLRCAAQASPSVLFLGVEVSQKYARFAAAGLASRGLSNAAVIHGDALRLFHEFLPNESVDSVHVYFPDPWWKARHKKRRIMNRKFVQGVERVLIDQGSLYFWTDVLEYFRTSVELIHDATSLRGPTAVPETPPVDDFDYRTHYERRIRQHGQPVFRSKFTKHA